MSQVSHVGSAVVDSAKTGAAADGRASLQAEQANSEAPSDDQKKKSIASRLFRRFRVNLFSSLTRRIAVLNILALTALVATVLYMNQFRAGLIDAKIESLLTQGRIIAGAVAGSATANPDAITIDPDRLLELQTGESLQPRLDAIDSLRYPTNPEQVAPVLRTFKMFESSSLSSTSFPTFW